MLPLQRTTATLQPPATREQRIKVKQRLPMRARKLKSRQDDGEAEVARLADQKCQQLIQNPTIRTPTSVGRRLHDNNYTCNQEDCRSLIVDHSRSIEYGCDKVGQQLSHLLIAYNAHQTPGGASEAYKLMRKFRTIMSLYWKLLKIDCIHLSLKTPDNLCLFSKNFDILNSRMEVLRHIESLEGYCDAINQLRLIIKSHSMIGVMTAYDKISKLTIEIRAQSFQETKYTTTNSTMLELIDWPV